MLDHAIAKSSNIPFLCWCTWVAIFFFSKFFLSPTRIDDIIYLMFLNDRFESWNKFITDCYLLRRFIFFKHNTYVSLIVVLRLCIVSIYKHFSLQLIVLFFMKSFCFDNCVNNDCIILSLFFSSFCRYEIRPWYTSIKHY